MGKKRLSSSNNKKLHSNTNNNTNAHPSKKFTVTTKSALKPRSRKNSSSGKINPHIHDNLNSNNEKKSSIYDQLDRNRSNPVLNYLFNHLPTNSGQPRKGFSLYKLLLLELNLPSIQSKIENPPYQAKNTVDATEDNLYKHSYDELINMIKIPLYLEKYMIFGLLICFNSFLTLFTLVPLKILIVSSISIFNYVRDPTTKSTQFQILNSIRKDLISLSLIFISLVILVYGNLDISKMYHDVRGQADIKLYVMFGVLEVAEKLCSSIGQDLLNILFQIKITTTNSVENLRFVIFYIISIIYLIFHSYILIYQAVSLNVAANSYSNALLTLLLSNQFSELKSSVFKKLDREGLFQITMADLSERFQLLMMLSIIAIRNLIQLTSVDGLIPTSLKKWNIWIGAIFGPGVIVIGSEIFVDWLKHCFICKFNKINSKIYKKFLYISCLDFLQVFKINSGNGNFSNHEFSDYIVLTRRIGLPLLAASVCFLRMTINDMKQVFIVQNSIITSICLILVSFFTLILVRIILVLAIFKIANRSVTKHKYQQKESMKSHQELSNEQITSSPLSSEIPDLSTSSIDLNFLPGLPNTEPSTINPNTRIHLYDLDEKIPPTVEERRNHQILKKRASISNIYDDEEELSKVMRYEMSSKRIW
ncbi:hypothetical protein KGF54_000407 [Candida jiufengensis]|uniref:uncharacterized protein n=1 Tax=Candida jiufengensis TaxID=497108 RepID=UPI002224886D|nr:uncharacterized protein KGF54_000407 [Candida jiufengensis]KAI5956790.1 hypothetical protein KGF54_000407 [Candida jiufengensis]